MSAGEPERVGDTTGLPEVAGLPEPVEFSDVEIPDRHGQCLISPAFESVVDRVQKGSASDPAGLGPRARSLQVCGIDFHTLRQTARRSMLRLAVQHTSEYRTGLMNGTSDWNVPIIMGGHQPDLFHCGVWFKNFLLSDIAQHSGALAIHFLVDNDLCRSTSIQVPVCQLSDGDTGSQWQTRQVFYDSRRDPVPWENCYLQDIQAWKSFPNRVLDVLPKMQGVPMIERLWDYTLADARPGERIGYLLSRARHRTEHELGLRTLEIPLSSLVSTPEFVRFSLHLLYELPKLHEIYNSELQQYRKLHRIRNHAQPLPNLGRGDGWYETPWWYYSQGAQTRYPLWASFDNESLVLSNRKGWQLILAGPKNSDSAVEQWIEELSRGSCLRPRALLTTMYARLVLSDLFVHGMGGARYDQLTDRIMVRFFGITAPPVVLATATMHLPYAEVPQELTEASGQNALHWQQLLRVIQSNPEAGLRQCSHDLPAEQIEELQRLQSYKQQLLMNIPPKGQKWEWHTNMKQINERLSELAQPSVKKIQATLGHLQAVGELRGIVNSREYSFCLFPIETIIKQWQR